MPGQTVQARGSEIYCTLPTHFDPMGACWASSQGTYMRLDVPAVMERIEREGLVDMTNGE